MKEKPLTNAERYLARKGKLDFPFRTTIRRRVIAVPVDVEELIKNPNIKVKYIVDNSPEGAADMEQRAQKYHKGNGYTEESQFAGQDYIIAFRYRTPNDIRRRIAGMRKHGGYQIIKELNDAFRQHTVKNFKEFISIYKHGASFVRNNAYFTNHQEKVSTDLVEFIVAESEIDGLTDEEVGRLLFADNI
jgi:hypothetical protein